MSLADLANEANKLEDDAGIYLDAVLQKLTQEVGEFFEAVQQYRGIYTTTKATTLDKVRNEAGDVLFNFFSILNRLGVDLDQVEELVERTLKNFKESKDRYKHNT